ncbi:MAG: homoserine dehydrogenase [bacterium]
MKEHKVNVGIIGWGTVGTGVVKILLNQEKYIREYDKLSINLQRIADLDITTPRGINVDRSLLTTDAYDVIDAPDIDIVVELIGGLNPAFKFISEALKAGKHVVTANKAVIASYGKELFNLARENKVMIRFEASVGGCIPIIKSLQEGLSANKIQSIYGIVNGTCNYILTQMTDKGLDLADVLKDAQNRGYAESDPTYDIEGIDSANKIAILASLAYGTDIRLDDVFVEGITHITQKDIQYAQELGYRIKLLAIAKLVENNKLQVRVHPTMLHERNMLANVNGVFNAIYVTGNAAGATMFYGRGAGRMPAASAVVGDIVEIAKNIASGADSAIISSPSFSNTQFFVEHIGECKTRYYLRMQVLDQPGVLASISGILGKKGISISSVIQKERHEEGSCVPLVLMTHEAVEKNVVEAVKEIDALSVIKYKTMFIRVEALGDEETNLAII